MPLLNDAVSRAAEAATEKILEKKAKYSIYAKLIKMIKAILEDPEKAELTLRVNEQHKLEAVVTPDRAQKQKIGIQIGIIDG